MTYTLTPQGAEALRRLQAAHPAPLSGPRLLPVTGSQSRWEVTRPLERAGLIARVGVERRAVVWALTPAGLAADPDGPRAPHGPAPVAVTATERRALAALQALGGEGTDAQIRAQAGGSAARSSLKDTLGDLLARGALERIEGRPALWRLTGQAPLAPVALPARADLLRALLTQIRALGGGALLRELLPLGPWRASQLRPQLLELARAGALEESGAPASRRYHAPGGARLWEAQDSEAGHRPAPSVGALAARLEREAMTAADVVETWGCAHGAAEAALRDAEARGLIWRHGTHRGLPLYVATRAEVVKVVEAGAPSTSAPTSTTSSTPPWAPAWSGHQRYLAIWHLRRAPHAAAEVARLIGLPLCDARDLLLRLEREGIAARVPGAGRLWEVEGIVEGEDESELTERAPLPAHRVRVGPWGEELGETKKREAALPAPAAGRSRLVREEAPAPPKRRRPAPSKGSNAGEISQEPAAARVAPQAQAQGVTWHWPTGGVVISHTCAACRVGVLCEGCARDLRMGAGVEEVVWEDWARAWEIAQRWPGVAV